MNLRLKEKVVQKTLKRLLFWTGQWDIDFFWTSMDGAC